MLVGDLSIGIDDKGFGYAVDAPFNSDSAISVGARTGIGVTERVQPFGGVRGRVLVIQTMDGDRLCGRKLREKRMLLPAGDAPGCKHIDERNLAFEIRAGQPQSTTLDRRQRKLRYGSADQRRWDFSRVQCESKSQHQRYGQEHQNRSQIDPPVRLTDRLCHRSEEHTSELQSLMRISYAVFC